VDKKMQAHLGSDPSRPVHLMMPLAYMNQSGLSVRAVSQFYRILPEEILVVHDELDVAAGRFKLKTGGGHGGHNGLRDVMAHLGHDSFHRLRVGIGHPGHKDAVLNYVLDKPSVADTKAIHQVIDDIIHAMTDVLALKFSHVMNHKST
jgi:PTH1 family peptidyl-tRNA hydrolase